MKKIGILDVALGSLLALGSIAVGNTLAPKTRSNKPRQNLERTLVQEKPATAPIPKETNELLAYAEYTSQFEGKRNAVYDPLPNDGKDEPTIGVGHYLGRADSRETFARVLPGVNYEAILEGKQELTDSQVNALFAEDIEDYVGKTKRAFPKFDTYPEYLRQALVDGFYRGDLSGSPKTRKLINEGKFGEASKEYLDNREYLNAEALGRPGIRPRMEENSAAMQKYASELSSN